MCGCLGGGGVESGHAPRWQSARKLILDEKHNEGVPVPVWLMLPMCGRGRAKAWTRTRPCPSAL